MKRRAGLAAGFWLTVALSFAAAADNDPTRVLEPGKPPAYARLGEEKTLNDYFPFHPPATKEAWEQRRQELREQVLVANGLWPLPEKAPLKPVVHGKIEWDDYTIEKVYFASYPGHYVCGNLYRPRGKSGKVPGVLCPHGHWPNGRFYEAPVKTAQEQVKSGAERTYAGGFYPLQARCAQLARMGCVVFHYDMVGYADSQQLGHRTGFTDAEAELRLQSFMGLQTFNSIRALDFLLSLPDVDPQRIGVTGASGGGTQTFTLCAVDDRPTVAFPAVMVSTAMQGGCVCENCSYLRQGTGNVELAGLFAPKPLAMSGAHDWTVDIETKGLPELKALYRLYGAEDRVLARCFPMFEHNYNQVSREVMYNWFNQHLRLGHPGLVSEKPFVPVPPQQLAVFDKQHPLPKDAVSVETLRKNLAEASDHQIAQLRPTDAAGLHKFWDTVGTALRVMVHDKPVNPDDVKADERGVEQHDGVLFTKLLLRRKGQDEQVPAVLVAPPNKGSGTVVVWVHPEGKSSLVKEGKLTAAAQQILKRDDAILGLDVFLTGEFGGAKPPAVNASYAGYTYGYNRPLLANRVHDILTGLAYARRVSGVKKVHLIGLEQAGPWVVLARALSGDTVERTAADLNQFRFEKVKALDDAMMLPGALKYGGLPAFAALCAPSELYLYNQPGTAEGPTQAAYQAAGAADHLRQAAEKPATEGVLEWLTR